MKCQAVSPLFIIDKSVPHMVCGGCPGCRARGNSDEFVPTSGTICKVMGWDNKSSWPGKLKTKPPELGVYYTASDYKRPDPKNIIREWTFIRDNIFSY